MRRSPYTIVMVLKLVDSQAVSASAGRRVACIQILGSLLPDLYSAVFRADMPHRLTVSDLKQPWRNDDSGWRPLCRESGETPICMLQDCAAPSAGLRLCWHQMLCPIDQLLMLTALFQLKQSEDVTSRCAVVCV